MLEYGAIGLPVLCNPTPMHCRLLGEDYPLFAATEADAIARLEALAHDEALWNRAAVAVRRVAERHRISDVGRALSQALKARFG